MQRQSEIILLQHVARTRKVNFASEWRGRNDAGPTHATGRKAISFSGGESVDHAVTPSRINLTPLGFASGLEYAIFLHLVDAIASYERMTDLGSDGCQNRLLHRSSSAVVPGSRQDMQVCS